MSSFKWLIDRAEEINDAIIPGPGKLFGLNPKKDIITPLDAVPFLGPANKLNRGRKLLQSSKAWKFLAHGGAQLIGDVIIIGGIVYGLTRGGGSGAPLTRIPNAPKRPSSAKRVTGRSCPPGMRWDRKKGKCVRIRKR